MTVVGMEMLFESLGKGVICKRGGEKWICADAAGEGRGPSPLPHASSPSTTATRTWAPAGLGNGRREGPGPQQRGRAQSQLSPEHGLVSRKQLVSEQHDAEGRAGGLSQTRWTRAFDTELIPKIEATPIHLSFRAVRWGGRRGLVSGTGGPHAKRPRAHLKLR